MLKGYCFLTEKPVIYVANIAEDAVAGEDNDYVKSVRSFAEKQGEQVLKISAKIEEEIAMLDEEEKGIFIESWGLRSLALTN